MTKYELIEEWLRINIELNNNLEMLKTLDNEREILLKLAEKHDEPLSHNLQKQMQTSFEKYKDLSTKMKTLRAKSENLKQTLKKILTDKEWQDLSRRKS